MTIVTRFAPSPTGLLHIGGARTALFNYLFSKHHNGKFLLRIEDTDKQRSTQEAIDAILAGLKWLNLNWDDEVVMQSENIKTHQEIAYKLLKSNHAYYCYCLPKKQSEQIEICNCSSLTNAPNNIKPSIRLKIDKSGISTINDLILGQVVTPKKDIEDFIILRSDGTPTYLLAVVVDDINMGITHVIRGNDHLSNTFKQKEIYLALEKELPSYAHIPLIHGADGQKLSKRHGALGVNEYQAMGYLNAAVVNYLLKLGWSYNNQDIISLQEAITHFNIKQVHKSPARFDFNKLNSINSHYLKNLPTEELFNLVTPFITELIPGLELLANSSNNLLQLLPFLQTRFKNLMDIAKAALFIIIKQVTISSDCIIIIKNEQDLLQKQLTILNHLTDFSRQNLHDTLTTHAKDNNYKLGNYINPLRIALCGQSSSPASVFDILHILGKEETLERISQALSIIS